MYRKNGSRQGNQSIQFCFSYGPYMIACFHENFAIEACMKVELGEKSKYDSQFALREFPDYAPLRDLTQESVAPL